MITLIGATGQTGQAAAEQLLDAGEPIRVIGRTAARLQPLVDRGAEAAVGEVTDVPFLTRAFTGADAVYIMFPPDYSDPDYYARYERLGQAFAEALTAAKVTHAVLLSSLGAELSAGTGPIVGLHRQEARLSALPGLNLLILRPGAFYENQLGTLGLIKHQGINGGAETPDTPTPAVAAADVGVAVAAALRSRDFSGVTIRELTGPRLLTPREITSIIGDRIGKPDLPYIQFDPDGFLAGVQQATGFPKPVVELFLEMGQAFNAGLIERHTPVTPDTTGATTFEEWVDRVVVPAYRQL
jgi:uncharacterized protein YbjT (DUF2867 family)